VLPALGVVWKKVGELAAIDDRFEQYAAARDSIKPQLEDLSFFLRSYAAGIDASPARLQEIEDRLALLERLKKKYGPTLSDVIEKRASLKRDLDLIGNSAERRAELDRALDAARARFLEIAGGVSNRRRAAARQFASALTETLGELAMPRTRCDVRFAVAQSDAQWTERGVESAEFYISPNPGEDLKPLVRIASGGELSRIMLALKTLASTDAPGKTLIFDEVDTGIGGAAADVVGGRLRRLSERCQVLCITHLPQIAAHGTTHFSISKSVKGARTSTQVTRLDAAEREEELARMIGGADISAAVRAGAREMLISRSGVSEESAATRGAKAKQRQKAKGESGRDVT
jgi:DNA repair protein RecN (Recombination protein N)